MLSDTFCYSKLANYQQSLNKVDFLKPGGAIKAFGNLDGVKDSSDCESFWRFADEVEPELVPLLFQRNCIPETECENDIRSLSIVKKWKDRPAQEVLVS